MRVRFRGGAGARVPAVYWAVTTPVSSARAISLPLLHRMAGSFSSARSIAAATSGGTSFTRSASGVGRSVICLAMTETALGPVNVGWPENIS